jgi:hypothetical protein
MPKVMRDPGADVEDRTMKRGRFDRHSSGENVLGGDVTYRLFER